MNTIMLPNIGDKVKFNDGSGFCGEIVALVIYNNYPKAIVKLDKGFWGEGRLTYIGTMVVDISCLDYYVVEDRFDD